MLLSFFIGKHSLELYLWHEYIYDCIWNLNINPYYSFILAISLSFIMAYGSYKIFRIFKWA